MINIRIDEDGFLEMLNNRVKYWTDDPVKHELFNQYYSQTIDDGVFNGMDVDIWNIVDNDYVNYLIVVDDEELNEYDDPIIEAEYKGFYLIRP